jgi:hypothetical protein
MSATIPCHAEGQSTGWIVVLHSGEQVEVGVNDSLGAESLILVNGERIRYLALDSIDYLIHRPSAESTPGPFIGALGGAALGVGIFLNNIPEQSDLTMSSGLVYGLEFGGAALLGAAIGYGVGYLVDRLVVGEERFDLRRATHLEKGAAIQRILSGAAP